MLAEVGEEETEASMTKRSPFIVREGKKWPEGTV
jgi:hypothetical protein